MIKSYKDVSSKIIFEYIIKLNIILLTFNIQIIAGVRCSTLGRYSVKFIEYDSWIWEIILGAKEALICIWFLTWLRNLYFVITAWAIFVVLELFLRNSKPLSSVTRCKQKFIVNLELKVQVPLILHQIWSSSFWVCST